MPTADREEAIFAAVLEKPTRAERAAYLEGVAAATARNVTVATDRLRPRDRERSRVMRPSLAGRAGLATGS